VWAPTSDRSLEEPLHARPHDEGEAFHPDDPIGLLNSAGAFKREKGALRRPARKLKG
jgi:hypothetical protein